jgi:serine/threonine-protein kinase
MGENGGLVPAHSQTVVSTRRRSEHETHARSLRRMYLVGCIAWPLFTLPDVLPFMVTGEVGHIGWLVGLRALGEMVAVAVYVALAQLGTRMKRPVIATIDTVAFVTGACLLGLMAWPNGGIASRFQLGVLMFVFTRCLLLPQRWSVAVRIPAACVVAYPASLVVVGLVNDPALLAQWHDRGALGAFLHDFLFDVAGTGMGVFGSHLIFAAKREMVEARKLGQYRLRLRIGYGAMGEVWIARQISLGRDVALKVMRDQADRSAEAVQRFQREARAASRLTHKNTIRIYDFGAAEGGILYIAMELLDGMDLEKLVARAGPLPPARVLHMARQICGSLAEAHDAGILHRDIKPANLFVTKLGDEYDTMKLLDFGVARVTEENVAKLTATGKLTGTPAYMSPEICGGDTRIDARSDIYSLGAVLYFMLTGTELFPNRPFAEVVMMHITKTPDAPSERLGQTVPGDLERVILRCLAKEPGARYASASAMLKDLDDCAGAGDWTNADARAWWSASPASALVRAAGAE